MDCASQFRAVMKAPFWRGRWKEKIFTQLFKTLVVNGFIECRLVSSYEFLETPELFVSLQTFRNRMSKKLSLDDYILDLSKEVLVYAVRLESHAKRKLPAENVEEDQKNYICYENILIQRRNRLRWFNMLTGQNISLYTLAHFPIPEKSPCYCVLCSYDRTADSNVAHQTRYKCSSAKCHFSCT